MPRRGSQRGTEQKAGGAPQGELVRAVGEGEKKEGKKVGKEKERKGKRKEGSKERKEASKQAKKEGRKEGRKGKKERKEGKEGRRQRRKGKEKKEGRDCGPMGLPLWTPLLGLWCALCLASGQRHTVFWNSTNPKFQREDYTVEVRLNEYLDIICPHYEDNSVPAHSMERYTLYLVEREEYDTCKPRSKDQVRWQCNRPDALHGPERLSEKFQRFTPFTLGKEFREGHEYYYISKPIHRHRDSCLKLKVKVLGKKIQIPPGHVPTQKGPLQSDDPDAPMLRSVGYNSAPRLGSPLPFISLLLLVFIFRGP